MVRIRCFFAIATLFAMTAQPVMATQRTPELQALDDALPGTLINDPSRLDWLVFGAGATSKAIKQSTSPGGGALQITSPRKGSNVFDIGANAPIDATINVGQRITVSFYARAIEADTVDGKGVVAVRIQQNSAPYPGFGDARLAIDSDWKLYEVTAIADRAIAAGQAVVSFQLAGARQTIEFGQTIVLEGASSIVPPSIASPSVEPSTPVSVLPAPLQGKGALISTTDTGHWTYYGEAAQHPAVAARGLPGDTAQRFTIATIGANIYDSGVNVPVTQRIDEGEILIVAVLARTISADTTDGLGRISVRVQREAAPYPGFGEHILTVGPTWKLIQIKTQAKFGLNKGEGAIALHLAGAKQVVEIAQVYLLDGVAP